MHVLMLCWAFPSRTKGGIAANVYNLSKHLKAAKVHVVTCGLAGEPEKEVIDGVHVTRVDGNSFSKHDFLLWLYHTNLLMIEKVGELVEKEGPFDLIHAHDWLVGRAAVELKHRFKLPLITTMHADEPEGRDWKIAMIDNQRAVHYIEEYLLQNSDRIVCGSSLQGQVANDFGLSCDKMVEIIPAGIDPAQFDTSYMNKPPAGPVGDEGASSWKKTVLYAGRLTAENGVQVLVAAIARLRDDGLDAELVIAGEGPYREDLMEQIYDMRLQRNIHFVGSVDNAMLVTLYRLSDAVAVPSLHALSATAVLEAMASASPVVASDVKDITDIIEDGVTGLKVKPGDSSALAKSLRRVLEDDSLAESLRKNARQAVAERYSWALVSGRTMEVYQGLVSSGRQLVRAGPVRDRGGISA